jgi:uncharacterized protein YjcR
MAMHQADEPRADDQAPARDRQVARARRREARSLWHRGWQLTQIAAELGVKYGTLAAWKSRDGWDEDAPIAVVEDRLEARIALLLDKEPFTEGDMKRVDFMMRQMERAARIRKFDKTGREGDLNPKIARRNDEEAKTKRADKRKNFLSPEQWQALLDDFHARNFAYQEHWWDHRDERTRKILKSRQIGATWYFAREALAKIAQGVLAGEQPRNQIFLSASQRQANKFRREIVGWVKRVTGVELKGNPIMLDFSGLTEEAAPRSTRSASTRSRPTATRPRARAATSISTSSSGSTALPSCARWPPPWPPTPSTSAPISPPPRPRPTRPMRSGRARNGTRAAAANSSIPSIPRSETCAPGP